MQLQVVLIAVNATTLQLGLTANAVPSHMRHWGSVVYDGHTALYVRTCVPAGQNSGKCWPLLVQLTVWLYGNTLVAHWTDTVSAAMVK